MKVIITGATGMVGEGVLNECLLDNSISQVLVVGRKTCSYSHPKLKEVLLHDFFNLETLKDEIADYQACYFCLGVSSVGMKEEAYTKITYDLTMNFAKTLVEINKEMTFCYVSGVGTDSSENGRLMWARVKGKTENDLLKLGFKQVFNFRPGILFPTDGLKNTLKFYKYFTWLFPVIRKIMPSQACSLAELGRAMISITKNGFSHSIVQVKDISRLSRLV